MEDSLEGQREGFRSLPSYITAIQNSNPNTYIQMSTDYESHQFLRLFICPDESRDSFIHCRRFIAVDGIFPKTKFAQTLLLAVTIDANGHTLLLAWAIVESENTSSWEYFLNNLQLAIPIITTEAITLISDRDKGLIAASNVLPLTVVRAYCCHHLRENLCSVHGRGMATYFGKIARACNREEFESALLQL